jgi:hypothetical protein
VQSSRALDREHHEPLNACDGGSGDWRGSRRFALSRGADHDQARHPDQVQEKALSG